MRMWICRCVDHNLIIFLCPSFNDLKAHVGLSFSHYWLFIFAHNSIVVLTNLTQASKCSTWQHYQSHYRNSRKVCLHTLKFVLHFRFDIWSIQRHLQMLSVAVALHVVLTVQCCFLWAFFLRMIGTPDHAEDCRNAPFLVHKESLRHFFWKCS